MVVVTRKEEEVAAILVRFSLDKMENRVKTALGVRIDLETFFCLAFLRERSTLQSRKKGETRDSAACLVAAMEEEYEEEAPLPLSKPRGRHIQKRALKNKSLSVSLNENDLRDYVTGFHKRKKKLRKESQKKQEEAERRKPMEQPKSEISREDEEDDFC
ncbi:hypothetical protein DITRI_Ditri02bG0024900 [Diplodiscus trichospermus]